MTTTTPRPTPQSATHQRHTKAKGSARQRIAFAIGNLGQAAFYNAMSTFFMTYTTTALFARTDKAVAARMIALITSLVVAIRIAEIFLDPCSATSSTTRAHAGAGSASGSSSAALCRPRCSSSCSPVSSGS